MGKYHEKKPLKKLLKARKNEMKEAEYVPEREIDTPKRKTKKRKKPTETLTHPRDRKKAIEKKLQKTIQKRFYLTPLTLTLKTISRSRCCSILKKTSKEKLFDAIIEKLPNNDKYYIEHRDGTNAFRIRRDGKQGEKDELIQFMEDLDRKINQNTNKSRISQLKRIRKEALQRYSALGETYVDIDDEKI